MAVEIEQSMPQRIEAIRRLAEGKTGFYQTLDRIFGIHTAERDMDTLLEAIDHVIAVLREAQRNNGGYGFVRGLLEYLGAEEVEA